MATAHVEDIEETLVAWRRAATVVEESEMRFADRGLYEDYHSASAALAAVLTQYTTFAQLVGELGAARARPWRAARLCAQTWAWRRCDPMCWRVRPTGVACASSSPLTRADEATVIVVGGRLSRWVICPSRCLGVSIVATCIRTPHARTAYARPKRSWRRIASVATISSCSPTTFCSRLVSHHRCPRAAHARLHDAAGR